MPIHLLHGPDSVRSFRAARELLPAAFKEITSAQLKKPSGDMLGISFFDEGEGYLLRFGSREKLDRKDLPAEVTAFYSTLSEHDVLVLIAPSELTAKANLVTTVQKLKGSVLAFKALKGAEASNYIKELASAQELAFTPRSVSYLAEHFGESPHLTSEVEKALLLVRAGKEELLPDLASLPVQSEPFKFTDAVAARDTPLAFRYLDQIFKNGDDLIPLLALLAKKVQLLLFAVSTSDDATVIALAKAHPYALKLARGQARHWKVGQLRTLYGQLLALDGALKGPRKKTVPSRLLLLLKRTL